MEFWGVQVPSGKPVSCDPEDVSYIHLSQAALGESITSSKGKDERVLLKLTVDDSEFPIATLCPGKCDHVNLDLILDREFTISHNGTSSVYLTGYKTEAVRDDDFSHEDGMEDSAEEDEDEDDDEDEAEGEDEDDADGVEDEEPVQAPVQVSAKENGKPAGKVRAKVKDGEDDKSTPIAGKRRARDVKSNGKPVEQDKNEDEDEDEEDDSDVDLDMLGSESDDDLDSDELEEEEEDLSDEEEEEEDEEEEEGEGEEDDKEEEQAKESKKRPFRGVQNTPAAKKSKVEISEGDAKSGMKGAKTPTPIATPKQQAQFQSGKKDKKSASENGPKPDSGKKTGRFVCTPCNKTFSDEHSLSQHTSAKHK